MRPIIAFFLICTFMLSTAFQPKVAFADSSPPQIKADWLVDIRTICVVGGVVLGGTWWVSKWMQTVEDRLKGGEIRFTALELKAQTREDLLVSIKVGMDRMLESKKQVQRQD